MNHSLAVKPNGAGPVLIRVVLYQQMIIWCRIAGMVDL
jgi:hypothetical protein